MEFSNKKRKKFIDKFRDSAVKNMDIKITGNLPKSTKVNSYSLREIKNTNVFNINEDEKSLGSSNNNITHTNLKNTCFYKTSYFLDKCDNK